eukprot:gene8608-biopygen7635
MLVQKSFSEHAVRGIGVGVAAGRRLDRRRVLRMRPGAHRGGVCCRRRLDPAPYRVEVLWRSGLPPATAAGSPGTAAGGAGRQGLQLRRRRPAARPNPCTTAVNCAGFRTPVAGFLHSCPGKQSPIGTRCARRNLTFPSGNKSKIEGIGNRSTAGATRVKELQALPVAQMPVAQVPVAQVQWHRCSGTGASGTGAVAQVPVAQVPVAQMPVAQVPVAQSLSLFGSDSTAQAPTARNAGNTITMRRGHWADTR